MAESFEIVSIDAGNVAEHGFFCFKSKRKSKGWANKLRWLNDRFGEGLRIDMVLNNGRQVGFVEHTPGEHAWRAVEARHYLVIHCIWIVGKGRQHGQASRLLQRCESRAEQLGLAGVAMVTSGDHWLADERLLLKNGYEIVDAAPPAFHLLAKRLGDAPAPEFPTDWFARRANCGEGLTLFVTDQCPYLDELVARFHEAAAETGMPFRARKLETSREVQEEAPSAYGVLNIVREGELLPLRYLNDAQLRELVRV